MCEGAIRRTIELAPIVHNTSTEDVFRGFGHSHFSHVKDESFHVTTQIPGIGHSEGLKRGLSSHIGITDEDDSLSFKESPWIKQLFPSVYK